MKRDVVTLIMQDHREFERLFELLQSGQGDRELYFQQLAGLLAAHSRAEEAEVYPMLAKAGAQDEAKHSREEHAEADELVAKLKKMKADAPEFQQTMAKLIEGVQHHIQEEESTALPSLREGLDEAELNRLGEKFALRRGAELEHGPRSRQIGGSEMTRDKLYEKAKEHNISGRSQMTKEELQEAVKAVS